MTPQTSTQSAATRPFDDRLLARMTGQLADDRLITTICAELAASLLAAFQKSFQAASGVAIKVVHAGTETAPYDQLISGCRPDTVFCTTSIDNWCDGVMLACEPDLVINLVERLLGGSGSQAVMARRLSGIELDISRVMFEQLAAALNAAVAANQTRKATIAAPFCEWLPDDIAALSKAHAAVIRITADFEGREMELRLIVPQSVLIKTKVHVATPANARSARPEWAEQLGQKVSTSQVMLKADVKLKPMTLSELARLTPGDVLPFDDEGEVRVLLSGNGKALHWCEFGKSGGRYMLRLQEPHGSERDLMRQLTS